MSVKCIVIDGWHKGHMIVLPTVLPVISLPRPAITTMCDCDPGIENIVYGVRPSSNDYQLAFRSVDGKSAIYTVKGDSEPMVSNRDWHTYPNDKPRKDTPLYVGCHDPRAIFESSIEQSQQHAL